VCASTVRVCKHDVVRSIRSALRLPFLPLYSSLACSDVYGSVPRQRARGWDDLVSLSPGVLSIFDEGWRARFCLRIWVIPWCDYVVQAGCSYAFETIQVGTFFFATTTTVADECRSHMIEAEAEVRQTWSIAQVYSCMYVVYSTPRPIECIISVSRFV